MTADEWLACTKPDPMLKAIADRASGRKLRLIACAVCRLLGDRIPDPRSRAAVAAAEQFSDGLMSAATFQTHAELAEIVVRDVDGPMTVQDPRGTSEYAAAAAARGATLGNPAAGTRQTLRWAWWLLAYGGNRALWIGEAGEQIRAALCAALREIIGPLSHPLVLMPTAMLRDYGGPAAAFRARVTDTARGLAEGIADELAFDRLPILADALEDAGLDDRPVLDHLRHGTGHVRGCWALDLVLGRA